MSWKLIPVPFGFEWRFWVVYDPGPKTELTIEQKRQKARQDESMANWNGDLSSFGKSLSPYSCCRHSGCKSCQP
jgi:hypothetical protein